jgi:hypothetical protein
MSSKIQDLIKQVGTDVSGKWVAVDNVNAIAELIVQECAMVVEKNLYKNIGWNTSRAVKRHFGIEDEE